MIRGAVHMEHVSKDEEMRNKEVIRIKRPNLPRRFKTRIKKCCTFVHREYVPWYKNTNNIFIPFGVYHPLKGPMLFIL